MYSLSNCTLEKTAGDISRRIPVRAKIAYVSTVSVNKAERSSIRFSSVDEIQQNATDSRSYSQANGGLPEVLLATAGLPVQVCMCRGAVFWGSIQIMAHSHDE
jgi:hypothetical protein